MNDSQTKNCPYCDEPVRSNAIKCKHCGEWFRDKPEQSNSTSLSGIQLVKQALGSRYEIQHEIGRGGMATVYKAIQKNLNRPVALKVIHQNLLHDTEFLARFHREAQICASLQHPNIVTVHDEGEVSGVHFMAMEYLEGQDLRQIIRSRDKITPEQTLQYLLPVAEALEYAHSRGLIHRDIKSANIFVCNNTDTERSRSARIVLMDFGIAHAAAGTQLTRAGTVIGTPEYMSPEQADGRQVDARTDLYSLGVVMYECLTRCVPFASDTAVSTIYKVINEKPDESRFNFIPKGVKALTMSLLSKNPDHRPKSGGATAQAIRLLQQGKEWQPATRPPQHPEPERHTIKVSQAKPPDKQFEPRIHHSQPKKQVSPAVWVLGVIALVLVIILVNHQQNQRKMAERNRQMIEQQQQEAERQRQQTEQRQREQKVAARRADPFLGQMVFIKGGTFTMGCTSEQGSDCYDDEKPTRWVTVSDFYIGKYEVTQMQWRDVMGNNPSNFKNCDHCPVENVSWNDIQKFIKKLNQKTGKKYRLPTEAEWEFAARGGASKGSAIATKYAGSNIIDDVAWYTSNSDRKTRSVGGKKPNELDLYDMSGNVWEWCNDWYDSYSNSSQTNPQGPSSGSQRVLRGGGWSNYMQYCRVALRNYSTPDGRRDYFGFRLARSS